MHIIHSGHIIIPCSHIPLLSLLALIFAGKKTSSIFIKLKQDFIKILNTNKDGIWSGPLPGNFPAEWPLDTCDFCGQNPEAHCTFPWDFVVVFQEPQLSESQDVTWSSGRWGLQVSFRSNTHQAPPPTNKLRPSRRFVFVLRITVFNQATLMGWSVALCPEDTPLHTRTLPPHQSSVAVNFLGRDREILHYDWVLKSPVFLLRPCELVNPLTMSWEKTISCPFSPLSYCSLLSPSPMMVLEPWKGRLHVCHLGLSTQWPLVLTPWLYMSVY